MTTLKAHTTIRRSRLGVMPFPRGEWSATVSDYCWNDDKRDLVCYGGYWYAVKTFDPFHPVPAGSVPSATSAYWELASQFSVLVAGMILAEHIAAGAITADKLAADAIQVTGQLIANAIAADSLNVGGRFKVGTTGIVELVDAIVSGRVRSSNSGTRAEFNPTTGCLDFYYDNLLTGSLGWHANGPNLNLYDPAYGYEVSLRTGLLTLRSGDGRLMNIALEHFSPVINPDGEKQVELYADSEGIVRVRAYSGTPVPTPDARYYTVTLEALPAVGGTVEGGGTRYSGDTATISATPNSGYTFRKWSDGDTNAARQLTWTYTRTLIAFFDPVQYTVTLVASPAAGGTVSGGGKNNMGTVHRVQAVPAAGYRFLQWSDGNAEPERYVTWDADKTLTASFAAYTPGTAELLPASALTASSNIVQVDTGWTSSRGVQLLLERLFWGAVTDAESKAIACDKGDLAGVLQAGKRYKLTITAWASAGGKRLIAFFGSVPYEPMELGAVSLLADGEGLAAFDLTTSAQTFEYEFAAMRTSTVDDALYLATDDVDGVSYISKLSLKEA